MQKFRTLAAFFLVEKQQPRREEERKKKNAKYYGHFGAGARTPLGPILDIRECQFRMNHHNVMRVASSLPLDKISGFCHTLHRNPATKKHL